MKRAAIVVGVLAVAVAVVGAAAWMGLFVAVSVAEENLGPFPFVYVQEPSTDFGKIGDITETLGAQLEAAGVAVRKPAQIYFPSGRGIQNQIGFVVERAQAQEVLGINSFFRNVPAQRYAVAKFPFRNPLSFLAGYYRVGPKLKAYRKDKGIAESSTMVILEDGFIVYLQPVVP